jgi:hypothetical protein
LLAALKRLRHARARRGAAWVAAAGGVHPHDQQFPDTRSVASFRHATVRFLVACSTVQETPRPLARPAARVRHARSVRARARARDWTPPITTPRTLIMTPEGANELLDSLSGTATALRSSPIYAASPGPGLPAPHPRPPPANSLLRTVAPFRRPPLRLRRCRSPAFYAPHCQAPHPPMLGSCPRTPLPRTPPNPPGTCPVSMHPTAKHPTHPCSDPAHVPHCQEPHPCSDPAHVPHCQEPHPTAKKPRTFSLFHCPETVSSLDK